MRFFIWNNKNEELARAVKQSSKTLADSITEASKNDVKARDRVDITLEEYERLKEENKQLMSERDHLLKLLTVLRIPTNIWRRVKINTVKTSVCHDIKDFVDTFRIEFDVDVPYPYGEDYEY